MVRGSIGKLVAGSLALARRWQKQQLRRLNVHEYQGAELMSKYGINVPKGVAASSIEEVKEAIKSVFPSGKEVSLKVPVVVRLEGTNVDQENSQGEWNGFDHRRRLG
ncbi:succinate--CoA ligase [ADP-forming] subunit beta, mitochondrial-like isoform X2 [Musa acuminata AAA Group]|uniref:succinate--CoA ligase [ADP-forming] subunit beta, mitochondrial-like isoform X2 n=1 Tax=Musa acuminata AAA Group TaxID=214697 RepID=UPI0031CFB19D